MAANFDILVFKKGLKWYKKILFPMFLNKDEFDKYLKMVNEEYSELDEARDYAYFLWKKYEENPNYQTKNDFEIQRRIVEYLQRKEGEK